MCQEFSGFFLGFFKEKFLVKLGNQNIFNDSETVFLHRFTILTGHQLFFLFMRYGGKEKYGGKVKS